MMAKTYIRGGILHDIWSIEQLVHGCGALKIASQRTLRTRQERQDLTARGFRGTKVFTDPLLCSEYRMLWALMLACLLQTVCSTTAQEKEDCRMRGDLYTQGSWKSLDQALPNGFETLWHATVVDSSHPSRWSIRARRVRGSEGLVPWANLASLMRHTKPNHQWLFVEHQQIECG